MKTKINAFVALLMTMIMLSSCADLWVVKRRYNRGYFISPGYKERSKIFDQKRAIVLQQRSLQRNLTSRRAGAITFDQRVEQVVDPLPLLESGDWAICPTDDTGAEVGEAEKSIGPRHPATILAKTQVTSSAPVHLPMAASSMDQQKGQNRNKGKEANHWWWGLAMALLSTQLLLQRKTAKHSYRLSRWAAANPNKARAYIAVSTIALAFSSLQLGLTLASAGVSFGKESLYASWALASGGVLLHWLGSGSRAKLAYIMLISGGTLGMLPTAEIAYHSTQNTAVLSATYHSTVQWNQDLYANPQSAFHPVVFDEKLEAKFSDEPVDEPNPISAGKAFALILFSVILFVALQYLVLIFACGIYCSGYELAAALLGFGGTALLLLGLIHSILSVAKRRRRTKGVERERRQQPAT